MSVLLIVLACIALNAGLAALEVALISASKAGVKAHGGPNDVRVQRFLRLRETPERALSAIQVTTAMAPNEISAVRSVGDAVDSVWRRRSIGCALASGSAPSSMPKWRGASRKH